MSNDDKPKKFQPDTPADTLHAHVQKHLDLPDHEKMSDDNEEMVNELTAHPNLGAHSIKALYDNAMAHNHNTDFGHEGTAEHQNMSSEAMENLLKHPNTPREIKHDFAMQTFHPDNAQSSLHEDMADTNLNADELRNISEKLLGQGEEPHAYKNLPPAYYLNHFKKAAQTEPAEGEDSKAGNFGYKGLIDSAKHTPETLDQTIDAFNSNKHFAHNGHSVDNPEMFKDLVESRQDLSKDQLNKIHQMTEGSKKKYYHDEDVADKILEHPNVDPSLVAKYAVGKDVRPAALKSPNLPKETMDAFVRRSKDPNDYNERTAIGELLQNPKMDAKHVAQLVKRGSKLAINHPLASEEDIRNHWNQTDKGLEAARGILQAKNLPPDILKELVNHKNQDVAVDAINHPKSDMDVVQAGLARRAKTVQDAARIHPLVAESQVKEGLQSGKTSLSNIYADEDFKANFDKLPKADQEAVFNKAHEKYAGTDIDAIAKGTKERSENVIHSKFNLASDPRVPEPIREKHSKDLANMFNDKIGKNKVPNIRGGNILSDRHEDDNSRVSRAIVDLSKSGDKNAQKAILGNPAVMQGLRHYVGKDGFDQLQPNFLESLYRKGKEYEAANDQMYDERGQPVTFDKNADLLQPLFQSKNLPSNVFDEIAANPAEQEKLGEHDEFNRYNDLPPEQQTEKYRNILNSGSKEAAKSVIRANAPTDSWNRALGMLEKPEQDKIIGNQIEHIKQHRPDIYNYAALGMYNAPDAGAGQRYGNPGKQAQVQALEKLKPGSPGDLGLAKQAMSIPEGQTGHLNDQDAMNYIPENVLKDGSMVDHAVQIGRPSLAHTILGRALDSESYDLGEDKAKGEALMTKALARVQSMPPEIETDNVQASNWQSLIDNAQSKHSDPHLFKNLKRSGVSLDFMADMPGDAGANLREAALKNNLLSRDKLAEVASKGSIDDVLAIGRGDKRQEAFAQALKNPNLDADSLQKITYAMNTSLLDPEAFNTGRRKSMSPEAHATYQSRLNSLVDLYTAKAPDDLGSMLYNAMQPVKGGDSLTKEDISRITKGVMEHVANKAYATPSAKNMATYQLYKGLKRSDSEPSKVLGQLEKNVFETKDYDTMVKMATDANLSDEGLEKLAKVVRQPETLNSDQIAGLSTRFDNRTEPQTVVSMAKTFEMKIAQESIENPSKDQTPQKLKLMGSLSKTYNPKPGNTEEEKVKNDFALNYTKKQTLDPKTSKQANTQLVGMAVRTAASDLDKSAELLASLPDDREAFTPGTSLTQTLTDDLANDSRFVEAAQAGWKLNMLAGNADKLTGKNASILTNRAMADESNSVSKLAVFSDLDDNPFTASEDSVKLGRTLSENDFNTWVRNNEASLTGNGLYSVAARMKDLEAIAKDPNKVAAGAPFMGAEHRNKLIYNVEAMSNAIRHAKPGDGISDMGGKMSRVAEIIDAAHGHIKTVAAALRDEVEKSGHNTDIGRDQQFILSIARNIAQTGLKLDRSNSLKVMDMVKEFNSIPKESGELPSPQETYETVSNIVQRAEQFEDQDWKEMFTSAPHAVFQLSKRGQIPTEAMNSVDYKSIEDAPLNPQAENLQDMFAKTSADWFNKMSQDDMQTHGKNLMGMYTRMQNQGTLSTSNYKSAMTTALAQMGRHMSDKDVQNLLSSTKDHVAKQDLYQSAVKYGAGGVDTLKAFARDYQKVMGTWLFADTTDHTRGSGPELRRRLEPITTSPHLDDELSGKVCDMFDQNPELMVEAMGNMLDNKNAPGSAVTRVSKDVLQNHVGGYKKFDQRQSTNMATKLMSHPNIPEQQLMEMFNFTNTNFPKYFGSSDDKDTAVSKDGRGGQFNPALQNPTFGGKLLRAMPIHIPKDVPGVQADKVTRSVNLQNKDFNKVKEIIPLIPAEGISWVEFKRKYPAQEKVIPAAAKAVFMAGQNKPVMPEQFVDALQKLDDNGKKYHLTFSRWTSDLQRHRGAEQKPNLVVQVNNSEESEKELSRDPKLWSLYQQLLQQANGVKGGSIGLHPTTPHLVSWSRVDTDQDGKAWVIEEAQSDFAQKFRGNLKALISAYPAGASINGHKISADEMQKYAKVIDKHVEDWSEASMQAVLDNAKAHGIKKIYMHGAEMRAHMSGGIRDESVPGGYLRYSREFFDNPNTKPRTVGFRKIYDENPRKYGFKECDYTDYPEHSQQMLKQLNEKKLSTKCWTLDLSDDKPKRKAKA